MAGLLPGTGGYSVGFSSDQLANMAEAQGYILGPCVYDERTQYLVVQEIISDHVRQFRTRFHGASPIARDVEHAGVECAREIGRFGTLLKHRSFKEEREWRLISRSPGVNHPDLQYRPGRHSVIPYLEFSLTNSTHSDLNRRLQEDSLTVVIGPTLDMAAASFAVQSHGHNCFPPGWAHGSSETPYRGI